MAGWLAEINKRNIIPRWRDFEQTLNLGELNPINKLSRKDSLFLNSEHHQKKISDWQTERTVKNAVELLNSSYIADDLQNSKEVAAFLKTEPSNAAKSTIILSEQILSPNKVDDTIEQIADFEFLDAIIKSKIQKLRSYLHHNQNNSISWIELARLYLLTGKELAAERCILVAIHLSPHNRYISRVASRYFTHTGDFRKAKQVLKNNMAFAHDPWLIGADIGISTLDNKSSFHIKKGREMIASDNYSSFELNELLSALATEELNAGSVKNSKRLFNRSLIQPNDNSLAQAVWAKRHVNDLNFSQIPFEKIPNIYEAKAYQYFNAKQWNHTMANTLQWFLDQPFSIEPATFGSFIACSVLEKYDEAIKLCTHGLKATPGDFTLMNNLAYSYLRIDDVTAAQTAFNKIHADSLDDQQRVVYLATKGLLMYKLGSVVQGEALYNESSQLADKIKDKKLKLLADFHHVSIQLEMEGYPQEKIDKVNKLSSELESLNEVYLTDVVNNLKKRFKR